MGSIISYNPPGGQHRRALRSASPEELLELSLAAVRDAEQVRQWCEERGIYPPDHRQLQAEADQRAEINPSSAVPGLRNCGQPCLGEYDRCLFLADLTLAQRERSVPCWMMRYSQV